MQWLERKFENRVLEQVSKEISIQQVELSNISTNWEKIVLNSNTLVYKLYNDIPSQCKTVRDRMDKINTNLQKDIKALSMDPNSNLVYYTHYIFAREVVKIIT